MVGHVVAPQNELSYEAQGYRPGREQVEGPDVYGILQVAGEPLYVSSSLPLSLLISATCSR